MFRKLPGGFPVCLFHQLSQGELAGSVPFVTVPAAMNGHKNRELAFTGPNLGNIDMEIAYGIAFEALPFRFVHCPATQACMCERGHPCPADVKCHVLEGSDVQKIASDKKCRAAKHKDNHQAAMQYGAGRPRVSPLRLCLERSSPAPLAPSPRLAVRNRLALSPFGKGLHVDAKLATQLRIRSLRSLYGGSDGARRRRPTATCLSQRANVRSSGSRSLTPATQIKQTI